MIYATKPNWLNKIKNTKVNNNLSSHYEIPNISGLTLLDLYKINCTSGDADIYQSEDQHKLSRKQGSRKNEKKISQLPKTTKKVNKIHKYIANQRLDNLRKLSTEIANQYDVVCVETLNMRAMSNKGFGNGKARIYSSNY